ncbi:peroxiredoxin-like family protein [Rubrivirga sp. S365]|uniref:peroxiredoxin-like family protein n=1 Tax=Rubrivirga sp. S365 TaxID=3076080 RepID=UPI0028C7DD93|nr:peroxiredoxin-like family protein [Rubrivirga sp. S365]MDT7858379.1 peroxiredoxin-like family protein [Rubrivirga sp. S365]
MPTTPVPRQPVPDLSVDLVDGGTWRLADQSPQAFTLVVAYRGLHCPVCKSYLETLSDVRAEYAERGVEAVAVSMDSATRARKARMDWDVEGVPIGYGMTESTARAWGLYLSRGIKDGEPDLFSEPGLFLVRADGTLYYAAVNSAPWGRPHLPSFLKSIDFIQENDYPARGEVVPESA